MAVQTKLPDPASIYPVFSGLMEHARRNVAPNASDSGLGGRLVLYDLLDEAGSAAAIASSMAGAASLGVDPDSERLKQAVRNGVCDFVVNGLDEALRILKNEIRKKQPVAVGLQGGTAACLAEIVERGVQPDLLASAAGEVEAGGPADASLAELVRRGAISFSPRGEGASVLSDEAVRWRVEESPARWLPKLDALAAEVLAAEGAAAGDQRLRWLRLLPRYFSRAPHHFVEMTSAEAIRFVAAVRGLADSGAIGAAVTIEQTTGQGTSLVEAFGKLRPY